MKDKDILFRGGRQAMRLAVNQKDVGALPTPGAKTIVIEKKCGWCKEIKPSTDFCRNCTQKDGLQTVCKLCAKTTYGKWLNCTRCNEKFYIKHRNIKGRRSYFCSKCVSLNTIDRNKSRSKEFILSTKGYEYIRDFNNPHGYIFNHRKCMENHLQRSLKKGEVIHHIDGDRTNNSIENLFLTDTKGHSKAHRSLVLIGYKLINEGKITFDTSLGTYRLELK